MRNTLSRTLLLISGLFSLVLSDVSFTADIYKNGFDLSSASIKVSEVLSGGPPRDGIPAIDQPEFVSSDEADFLTPDDRILGVVRNGVAKAYPISILNWHEIVNDVFDDEPVVITFCPLCGTGMAFEAMIDRQTLTFGVSGLLYNSDVLLYDRHSESLWSQIMKQSISGQYKGDHLVQIPLKHTSWMDWQRQYPKTLVLSDETGYSRNYQNSPYQGYEASHQLYFPVAFRSKGYHPKERVLGVEMDGIYKAYPFIELSKFEDIIEDNIGSKTISIHFDKENQTASIYDGQKQLLPSVTSFWFAWYTFHPNSIVFKAEE